MKSYICALALCFFILKSQAQISLSDLHVVSQAFQAEYTAELQMQNSIFFINKPPSPFTPDFWWDLDTVRAAYSSNIDEKLRTHYIVVMGGFGKLPGMNRDGIAATICHELGHGIAGAPFKNRAEEAQVAVEGQADYFAYRYCLARIFKRLPIMVPVKPVSAFTDSLCKKNYSKPEDLSFCTRAFQTLEVERMYLKYLSKGLVNTVYDKPDQSVVSETSVEDTFYPADQCRLDTMMAGVLQKPRPACWFK